MGYAVAVSRKPLDGATAPGRNRPGQPRIVTCRYLKPDGNQCTGEVTDENAEILLCPRHLAAAVEFYTAAVASLGADQ